MFTLKQLREKLAAKAAEARSISDSIKDDTTFEQSKEIEGRFDAVMAECDALDESIKRQERMEKIEARAAIAKRPVEDGQADAVPEARSYKPEYNEVFFKEMRGIALGVNALSNEERSLLLEKRAQSTGTDSAGGYTVPEGFSNMLEKSLAAWGPMWDTSICRQLNTSTGNALPWPTVDDTAKRGRIKTENAASDDDGTDDVVFGEKVLNAYVYDTGMVRIPLELIQDSAFAMEPLLTDLFSERLGRTANDVLTNGTGSNEPEGIVVGSSLGVTAASATAITMDELINLKHSIDPAYRMSPSFRWMFNDNTLAVIEKLKDGQGNYLWKQGDVRTGEPSTVLGHPYSINQAMDDIGTGNKPIILGDMSKYVVRKVNGFSVVATREMFIREGQVGMLARKRFDGAILNSAAIKHLINA